MADSYSIDLQNTGGEWLSTFARGVRAVVEDIISDGTPYGPVEIVLYDHRPAVSGRLTDARSHSLQIASVLTGEGTWYRYDEIERFRA